MNLHVQEAEEIFDVDQRSDIESDRSEIRDNRTGSEPERRENSSGTGLSHLQPNPFSLAGKYSSMIAHVEFFSSFASNLRSVFLWLLLSLNIKIIKLLLVKIVY